MAGIHLMDHIVCSHGGRFSIMQARLAAPIPIIRTDVNQSQFSRLWVRMHYRLAQLSRHDARAQQISDKGWLILMTLYFETRPLWIVELSEMLALEMSLVARQIVAMHASQLINVRPGNPASRHLIGLTAEGLDLIDDVFDAVLHSGQDTSNYLQFAANLRRSIKTDPRIPPSAYAPTSDSNSSFAPT